MSNYCLFISKGTGCRQMKSKQKEVCHLGFCPIWKVCLDGCLVRWFCFLSLTPCLAHVYCVGSWLENLCAEQWKSFMGNVVKESNLIKLCVYIFPPASSRFGQSLSRHRHSPLGTGHLCHLRQTARGKLGAHAAQLHSKVHRLLFSAVRKQLLPLAQVFTQTQTVGGMSFSAYEEG